jgi:DNA modification methylase
MRTKASARNRYEGADEPSDPMKLPWRPLMLSPSAIRSADRKTRTHSKGQIRQIADSILHLGFINPIVIDQRGKIIAGHARFEAAKLLSLKRIPVIRVEHLSEAELRAYSLADNKLAETSGYDREVLAVELEELQVLLPEIGLDLSITGFDPGEVDALLLDHGDDRPNPADDGVEMTNGPAVSRVGDLFTLGKHRIIVGDARNADTFDRLMQGEMAGMAFLDPPYNVKIAGHVGGRGQIKHREFTCASGEMSPDQFTGFLQETLGLCARYSVDGSIHYICMDWRHARELLEAGAAVYDELKNICVWAKTNAGQGSFYRSEHELVFVFKHGEATHLNTFGLGAGGRSRSNVWRYAGVNTFRAGRMDELTMHPTVKPVALVADAMRDCSRRGSIVLDAFAGSGTTIMAAEQIGRRAFCVEIDPAYADVAVRRWQRFTGRDAILEATGQTFEELWAERSGTAAKAAAPARKPRPSAKGGR